MSTEPTATPQSNPRDPGSARDRILRESLALFSVRGFADVSMSEIAGAVGITKAALYYHFTGKEELFATAFANEVAMVRDQITTIVVAGDTLDQTAYHLAMFFLQRGDRDMRRLHQDFVAFVSEDMRTDFFRDVPPEDLLAEHLNTYFSHLIDVGEIRPDVDIVSLVPIIFGMTHAQIRLKQNPKAPHAHRSNEEIAASIVDILLFGVVPR